MKPAVNHIQRFLVIVLLIVYVFTVSTYIIFLQSRIATVGNTAFTKTAAITHLASHKAAGNFYNKQHGAFKTTFPNKRRVISIVYGLVCLLVLTLAPLLFTYRAAATTCLMYAGQLRFITLRVLRI